MKFIARTTLFACFIALHMPTAVHAAPGDLDTAFASGGKFMRQMTWLPSSDAADTIAVLPDGKTVVAGACDLQYSTERAVCLVRYLENGALDNGFGGTGIVVTPLYRNEGIHYQVTTLRIEDGKIVVANQCEATGAALCLARFNTDGTLDATLNGTGIQRYDQHYSISARHITEDRVITAYGCMTLVPFNAADFCVTVTHRNGSLDTTFNGTGKVQTPISSDADNPYVVTRHGNHILVAGMCNLYPSAQLCVVRYNLDGSLDLTFNGTGKASVAEGVAATSPGSLAFAVQPDSKILIGGRSWASQSTMILARLNADGTRDTGFAGGLYSMGFSGPAGFASVSVAPDGKVAATGSATISGATSLVVNRWLSDGTADPQFGIAGRVGTPFAGPYSSGTALAATADGKLTLAASCSPVSGSYDFCVARYDASGVPDISFNGNGTAVTDLKVREGNENAMDVMRLPGGKLLILGGCEGKGLCVVRLNANGTLDTAFGTGGISFTGVGSSSQPRLARQGTKYLLLSVCGSPYGAFCVYRMNEDGSFDTSFGTNGNVQIAQIGSSTDSPHRLLVDGAGRILIAGSCLQSGKYAFCFARLNGDGSYDTTFAGTGRLMSVFGTSSNELGDITITTDGKIVAAGNCSIDDADACVARYLPDGTLDTTFGVGGWFRKAVGYSHDAIAKVHVLADGKILLLGAEKLNGGVRLARFHPSGAFDTSFNGTGMLVTPLFTHPRILTSAVVESNGKMLLSGRCDAGVDKTNFCMIRYKPDAQLDTAFGASGMVTTSLGPKYDTPLSMLSQDGKIVVVGGCDNGANTDFCVAQYLSDPVARVTSDFNLDNRPDLVWSNTTSGATYIWRMSGTNLISDSLLATIDLAWKVQGVADFNADGHNDIVWRNSLDGSTYVWYLVDGVFQSDAFLFGLPPEWVIQGVADFNADGKPDFLMRNTNSGNAFAWFFNNNVAIGDQFLFNIDPSWKVEGIADLNADGQPDLLFRNMTSGLAFAWNSQFTGGNLSLTTSSPPIFAIDSFWEVVQVADWNNDGKPDLLFRNRNTGVVFVWYLDGITLTTSDFIIQIDPSWEIVPRS